jgi:1-deoxy-D-xylulose-5-phosphate reductoisomerase
LRIGGAAPTILNAANEVAVGEFLARRVGFLSIALVVEKTLDALARECSGLAPASLEDVLALDALARARAGELCGAAAA